MTATITHLPITIHRAAQDLLAQLAARGESLSDVNADASEACFDSDVDYERRAGRLMCWIAARDGKWLTVAVDVQSARDPYDVLEDVLCEAALIAADTRH